LKPDRQDKIAKWRRRGILLAVFILGVLLIKFFYLLPWEWTHEVVKEMGVALIIAATLGATVDELLKIELVRDAFLAAFRYAFHPALQGEILRIMQYRLICETHSMRVTIDKIDKDAVRVTSEVRRMMKNIGSSREKIEPRLHIDDWHFPQEKSQIIECKLTPDDGKPVIAAQKSTSDPTILFVGKEVSIRPGKTVTVATKWSEVRRHNDSVYVHFSYPTINPEIEVIAPGFKTSRSFGSASGEISEVFAGRQKVDGTYLPHHYRVIRWRPDDAAERQGVIC
jgi:hypothetical protein